MIVGVLIVLGGALVVGRRVFQAAFAPEHPPPDGGDAETRASGDALPTAAQQADDEPASPPERQLAPVESPESIQHHLHISLASLGFAITGWALSPALSLLSAGLSLYASIPVFQLAHHAIFVERRPRSSILDALTSITLLLSGLYVLNGLGLSLFYLGRQIYLKTRDRSHHDLIDAFGQQQRTVWLLRDGVEVEISIEVLRPGDIVVVGTGQIIPVDGIVQKGVAAVDQHQLTGEGQPDEKGPGDRVLATTLVISGRICIEVERAGASTVAAEIGAILAKTVDYRLVVESKAERLGDQSVVPLLGLSGMALFLLRPESAVAVLASNYAENIRTSASLSLLNFLRQAARRGILIKDGRALELLSGVDTVVFDKTGTLTAGDPTLAAIHSCDGIDAQTLLGYAAAAEQRQSHPLARAIVRSAGERSLLLPAVDHARYQVGFGIDADLLGRRVLVGSARFMAQNGISTAQHLVAEQESARSRGNSLVFIAVDGRLGGILELCPTVRPETKEMLAELRRRGLAVAIISGDQEEPTRHLANELGVDQYFASVLPADKAALVNRLQASGRKVCYVGDGINDAIALKTATASISMSGATTAATDTAQVVMMDGTLRQLPALLTLTQDFAANLNRTLAAALVPSFFVVGGIFLLNFGMLAAIVGYNVSLVASVGSALLPAPKGDDEQASPTSTEATAP